MKQLAYHNGSLIPRDQLTISVTDSGFVLGTTVSEQLRTFGGRLFQIDQHFERLSRSLLIVGLADIDLAHLKSQAARLVETNHRLLDAGDDLGLTIFVTPGQHGGTLGAVEPTVGMYTSALPFRKWSAKYSEGEKLFVSSVRQIPSNCWPASLKCRSRMHYFLADREIHQQNPDARALLLDQDGYVAEASTANVLMYCRTEGIIAPYEDKVLSGISVSVLQSLAAESGLQWTNRNITVEEFCRADEVLLCSTSPCLLPVTAVNGLRIGAGTPGEIFDRLVSAWSDLIQIDIIHQARTFQTRD